MPRYTKSGSVASVPSINSELERIEEAMESLLSREGESPNQMEADLDMNGYAVLNVNTDPDNPNSLVSREDVYIKEETEALDDETLAAAKRYTDNAANPIAGGTAYPVTAEGAVGDGVTDDTVRLQAAFDMGGDIYLPDGVYLYSKLTISAPVNLTGNGVLKYDGSNDGENASITITNTFTAEQLRIHTDGASDTTFNLLDVTSDDVYIGRLEMISDVQRATTGGSTFNGSDIFIDEVYTSNVARPLEFKPASGTPYRNNIHIGPITCINYLRGAFFAYVEDFSVGRVFMRERWSGITTNQPGQNGLLFEGCRRFEVGRSYIADSAEHAVRLGGAANISDFSFGKIKTLNSAGCSFKSNVDTGFAATDGYIDGVTGINTGEGSNEGNREVVRLSKVVNLSLGNASGFDGCTRVVVMQDVDNITIGEVFGEGVRSRLIETRTDFDNTQSTVENVYIGNAIGYMSGARAAFGLTYSGAGREIKNFVIADSYISGYTHYGAIMTGANVTGEVVLNMRSPATDPRPLVENAPATALITVNAYHGGTPYFGNLKTFSSDAAAGSGGLISGEVYKTSSGEIRIKT